MTTGTRARDVFITLQKRLSPEQKPCSGKKVFEEEGSRRLKESSIRRGRGKEETRERHRPRSVLVLDEIALSSPTESSSFAETNDRMRTYLRDPIYLERGSP